MSNTSMGEKITGWVFAIIGLGLGILLLSRFVLPHIESSTTRLLLYWFTGGFCGGIGGALGHRIHARITGLKRSAGTDTSGKLNPKP